MCPVHRVHLLVSGVQGGEMEVLKSIDWSKVTFDVLCVETDPSNRPPGYAKLVSDFLASHGYQNQSGQMGRNICECGLHLLIPVLYIKYDNVVTIIYDNIRQCSQFKSCDNDCTADVVTCYH